MENVALVTGADRGLGLAIARQLLEKRWIVLAGKHMDWPDLDNLAKQYPDTCHLLTLDVGSDESVRAAALAAATKADHIDLLVSNAAINRSHQLQSIRQDQNFANMADEFNVNAIGALRLVHALLPLLDKGTTKRLCFVSSEAGSIGASARTGWFGYCMSKAALNMAVKNMSNDLGPQGYDLRLYHPGWLKTYMSGERNDQARYEPEEGAAFALNYFLDSNRSPELTLRDYEGNDYPW
ncbi:MAG: SDR family NAD(P)-dependent oxidoreductase [Armatimonadetes bacterium]|nr:SDR family NAD(P)-dependent oxidoreductase [Armatimonadota bacterium]